MEEGLFPSATAADLHVGLDGRHVKSTPRFLIFAPFSGLDFCPNDLNLML